MKGLQGQFFQAVVGLHEKGLAGAAQVQTGLADVGGGEDGAVLLNVIVSDVDYILGKMAEGDFDVRTNSEESYVGNFRGILSSMRTLNIKLSNVLMQINTAADQVSDGSEQVSSGAQAQIGRAHV